MVTAMDNELAALVRDWLVPDEDDDGACGLTLVMAEVIASERAKVMAEINSLRQRLDMPILTTKPHYRVAAGTGRSW
jgi:hypothetical protein